MPGDIFQIHSRDYRNPGQLPSGSVLVVGSGASGCQIAEELHQAGRKVYLWVGQFHKTPRRYHGRDIYWWYETLGIWHRPLELPTRSAKSSLRSDRAGGGHDIDLRRFAVNGMTLLGSVAEARALLAHTDNPAFEFISSFISRPCAAAH